MIVLGGSLKVYLVQDTVLNQRLLNIAASPIVKKKSALSYTAAEKEVIVHLDVINTDKHEDLGA